MSSFAWKIEKKGVTFKNMASSSSSFVNLKSKFDAKVKKDEDINKEYNKILRACLDQVFSDMRLKDATFGRLYQDLYYGGSFFDKLAVGNLRHEFDLDVIFRVKFFNAFLVWGW